MKKISIKITMRLITGTCRWWEVPSQLFKFKSHVYNQWLDTCLCIIKEMQVMRNMTTTHSTWSSTRRHAHTQCLKQDKTWFVSVWENVRLPLARPPQQSCSFITRSVLKFIFKTFAYVKLIHVLYINFTWKQIFLNYFQYYQNRINLSFIKRRG